MVASGTTMYSSVTGPSVSFQNLRLPTDLKAYRNNFQTCYGRHKKPWKFIFSSGVNLGLSHYGEQNLIGLFFV